MDDLNARHCRHLLLRERTVILHISFSLCMLPHPSFSTSGPPPLQVLQKVPPPHHHHLIPLPRRLRGRTPTHTPLIPPPQPQPLLRAQLQLPIQLRTRILPMNEIAEPPSNTSFSAIQSAASFAEIGNRGELAVDGACRVPARVQRVAGFLRRVFVLEARVDVANEIYSS